MMYQSGIDICEFPPVLTCDFNRAFRFTGREIVDLMRRNRVTISGLSSSLGVTMKQVRRVREDGICGHAACDWYECITGSLSQRMKAAYRQKAHCEFTAEELPYLDVSQVS